VNDSIHVYIPKRGKFGEDIEYTTKKFEEKFGLQPKQIIELKALMGDSSDNIPGVKGIGQKTATKLIQEFGSVERLYEAIEDPDSVSAEQDLPKGAVLTKLVQDKDNAFLSRDLATINCEAPVQLQLEDCKLLGYDKEKVVEIFRELEFESLVPLLPMDQFESGVQNALF
ncbi:MAG TPA: 5'-3' exonuclease H3TH domain-containing protein, partial [Patescibacteria group bacterium]